MAIQMPIRSAGSKDEASDGPLASFATEGNAYAILVRGDTSSAQVERAVREAAAEAVKHLSRKLLN